MPSSKVFKTPPEKIKQVWGGTKSKALVLPYQNTLDEVVFHARLELYDAQSSDEGHGDAPTGKEALHAHCKQLVALLCVTSLLCRKVFHL